MRSPRKPPTPLEPTTKMVASLLASISTSAGLPGTPSHSTVRLSVEGAADFPFPETPWRDLHLFVVSCPVDPVTGEP